MSSAISVAEPSARMACDVNLQDEVGRTSAGDGMLNVLCWNINCLAPTVRDMVLRHKSFRGFFDHFKVDIACFQEVKLPAARMTRELACVEGFQSFWATSTAKTGYSGVTTWCRSEAVAPREAAADCLGGDEQPELDTEGRMVMTDHGAFVLLNVYVPNAGDRPERARLPYKLSYLRALRAKMDALAAMGRQVIAVGDFNVAAESRDVHPAINFDGLYDSQELAELRNLAAAYPDVWRCLHPDVEGSYTVWEERTSARAFNVGLRIDYVFVSPGLLPYISSCEILTTTDIPPKWSDHAAILLRLRVRREPPQGGAAPMPSTHAQKQQQSQQQQQQHQRQPQQQQQQEGTTAATGTLIAAAVPKPIAAADADASGANTGAASSIDGTNGAAAPRELPQLPLPPPPSAPCSLWLATEARFVDKSQKSIRDIFGGRPSGSAAAVAVDARVSTPKSAADKPDGGAQTPMGKVGGGGFSGRKRAVEEGGEANQPRAAPALGAAPDADVSARQGILGQDSKAATEQEGHRAKAPDLKGGSGDAGSKPDGSRGYPIAGVCEAGPVTRHAAAQNVGMRDRSEVAGVPTERGGNGGGGDGHDGGGRPGRGGESGPEVTSPQQQSANGRRQAETAATRASPPDPGAVGPDAGPVLGRESPKSHVAAQEQVEGTPGHEAEDEGGSRAASGPPSEHGGGPAGRATGVGSWPQGQATKRSAAKAASGTGRVARRKGPAGRGGAQAGTAASAAATTATEKQRSIESFFKAK